MVDKHYLKNHLSKAFCSKCGNNLSTADLVPVTQLPLATVAHAICDSCNAANVVTITSRGTAVMPVTSDLTKDEVLKFAKAKTVTLEDTLNLHKKLKKETIWNLLQKKEQHSEKRIRL